MLMRSLLIRGVSLMRVPARRNMGEVRSHCEVNDIVQAAARQNRLRPSRLFRTPCPHRSYELTLRRLGFSLRGAITTSGGCELWLHRTVAVFPPALVRNRVDLATENLAFGQQVVVLQNKSERPRLRQRVP